MTTYLVRRLARGLLTVFAVMTVSFFLLRLAGDPTRLLLADNASEQDVATLRASLGYDRPLVVQFTDFIARAAQGDLGESVRQHQPALGLVLDRLPATVELAVAALLVGLVPALIAAVAIQLGGLRWLRDLLMWVGSVRQAIPVFVFGILLVLVFAVWLKLLPSMGDRSPESLILPALTMGTFEFALYLRLFTSAFAREQQSDYVRTAHSKGQRPSAILFSHILPNAVLPVLTVAGLNFGALLGGAAVVEVVFTWPGVGLLMLNAVSNRDFPVVQAGLLVVSVMFVLVNLLIDILHGALDPRVRLS